MAQRSKMERSTAELETSTSPATYQCIVCQMTTISLSRLHRHQTYQHTPEELSLSTIGLQCSLINNVHATKSIVYDNSWLCDPLKQAEFYTVSANLLNDYNNNPNNCNPVDYVVEKEAANFREEDNIEIADEQEIRDFDFRIDHSYGRVSFEEDSAENGMQIKSFRSIGTETNRAEFLEDLHQPETSLALCTETERIITYLEEVMQVEEIRTGSAEAHYDFKSSGKDEQGKTVNLQLIDDFDSPGNEIPAEKSKTVDLQPIDDFDSPGNEIPAEKSKAVNLQLNHDFDSPGNLIPAEESKAGNLQPIDDFDSPGNLIPAEESKAGNLQPIDDFDSAGNSIPAEESKDIHGGAAAKKIKVAETKIVDPKTNSVLKSAKKGTKVTEFKIPKKNSILKSAKKDTAVKEFKVPNSNSILKSAHKETQAEDLKVVGPNSNCIFKSAEKEIKIAESKFVDAEANLKSAKKGTEAKEFKILKAKSILKSADKETQAEDLKVVGPKTNCIFKSAEKELKVAEPKVVDSEANSVSKFAEKQAGVANLKVSAPEANGIIESAEKATNSEKPDADPFVNCVESLCIDLEKIKNKPQKRKRAAPRNPAPRKAKAAAKPRAPRKKGKNSDPLPESNTVIQEVDPQTEFPVKNDSEQSFKNSAEPPLKKAKISHPVPANITIKQEIDQDTEIPVRNYSASRDCAEINLNSQKTENSDEPPRKKAKTSNSLVENTTNMQNADRGNEIATQNDFASIKPTELSLKSQKNENSVELPRKEAKNSTSGAENTTIIQEAKQKTKVPEQTDFASSNHSALNLQSQKTGNSVKKIFSEEDIVEAQLEALFHKQSENQGAEIPVIDDSAKSHWVDYHVVKTEPTMPDEEDLAHDNFIQQYVDTCKAAIPAEIPVEVKFEEQEFSGDEANDPRSSEHSEDSVIASLPSTYTFPWYPPDINDYSILVLDPEAHQLVWSEVAIVDEKNKLQSDNLQENVVLPELTEADLRENEICENMNISSGSQDKESGGNLTRTQPKRNATKTKKKPRTNFELRPRKAAVKKML